MEDIRLTGGRQPTERKKPCMMIVRDALFAGYFSPEYIESAIDYSHEEGDLFVVAYVTCGTTWMQHIVYLIQNSGVPPANAVEFCKASPFFEICGTEWVEWIKRPGAIKTRIPLRLMRYSSKARYIVVIRNPYDVVLAIHKLWHKISDYAYKGSFHDSFENFMAGYVDSGYYFAFYKEWYERKYDRNVLFMVYEDMVKNPKEAILKVARFLGFGYETLLKADDGKVLKDVLKYSSFEEVNKFLTKESALKEMECARSRKLKEFSHEGRGSDIATGAPTMKAYDIRNVTEGEWKNYFSPEQVKRLKQRFRLETQRSGIANLWPDLGFHD